MNELHEWKQRVKSQGKRDQQERVNSGNQQMSTKILAFYLVDKI